MMRTPQTQVLLILVLTAGRLHFLMSGGSKASLQLKPGQLHKQQLHMNGNFVGKGSTGPVMLC